MTKINNEFGVGVISGSLYIMKSPRGRITRQQAVELAAWLIEMVDLVHEQGEPATVMLMKVLADIKGVPYG